MGLDAGYNKRLDLRSTRTCTPDPGNLFTLFRSRTSVVSSARALR